MKRGSRGDEFRAQAASPVAPAGRTDWDEHIEDSHWGREAERQRRLFQAEDDAFDDLKSEFRIEGDDFTHTDTNCWRPTRSNQKVNKSFDISNKSLCVSGH